MEPFDPEQRALSVEVAAVRWRAPDGAFAVLAGVSEEGEEVVLVGALDHVHEGESVAVQGGWQRHPRHGWRFVAERARVEEPASESALLAYLSSVKHVGPRGAQWLLERHGPEQVLAAVDRDPDRALREVPGIGPGRIGAAVRAVPGWAPGKPPESASAAVIASMLMLLETRAGPVASRATPARTLPRG